MRSVSTYVYHMEALVDLASVLFIPRGGSARSSSSYVFHIEALGDLAAVMYIICRLWFI